MREDCVAIGPVNDVTVLPRTDHHDRRPLAAEAPRGAQRRLRVTDFFSGEQACLVAIGAQHIANPEQLIPHTGGRRAVKQHGGAAPAGDSRRDQQRLRWLLKLQHNRAGGRERGRDALDVGRAKEHLVGDVLEITPTRVLLQNLDDGRRRRTRAPHHLVDVDAVGGRLSQEFRADVVVADDADKRWGAAELGERDGLIGAFSTEDRPQDVDRSRRPGVRQLVHAQQEVARDLACEKRDRGVS